MNAIPNEKRHCTIEKSIIQASKEVTLMREGKLPKKSLHDLFNNIEIWANEEEK